MYADGAYDAAAAGGTCSQCPGAASLDGLRCVACDGTSGPGYRPAMLRGAACECSSNADGLGVIAERSAAGELFQSDDGSYVQRCIVCEGEAVPDPAAGACRPCPYPKIVDGDGVCACPGVLPGGVRCSNAEPIQRIASALSVGWSAASYAATATVTGPGEATASRTISNSAALRGLLDTSAEGCHDHGNRTACNALGNLCVLQMYSRWAVPPARVPPCATVPASPASACFSRAAGRAR